MPGRLEAPAAISIRFARFRRESFRGLFKIERTTLFWPRRAEYLRTCNMPAGLETPACALLS
jgi:hypothetical protein